MTINEVIFSLLQEALFGQAINVDSELSNHTLSNERDVFEFWVSVYKEAQTQAIIGLLAPVVAKHSEIPEQIRLDWSARKKPFAIKYTQIAAGQNEICGLLQEVGVPVAVMKGLAAAIYYPIPEYRAMGDVDLLVSPANYENAVEFLKEKGYVLTEDQESQYHTSFVKYNILYELHKSPAGVHRAYEGDTIAKYILSGLKHVEVNEIGQDQFPILPWKQNGMELIWHIRQHLYNGLGLRQIIDWMMFVNYMLDDKRMKEYMPDLKKCGLDSLAIVVTKMCQKYLGLSHDNITWCDGADENVCDELMTFIMGQGDFGVKAMDEKTAKVFSGYSNPKAMLQKLQSLGENEWGLLKKYPVLSPLAFFYGAVVAGRPILTKNGGIKQLITDLQIGQRRKRLFSRLYGRKKRARKRKG